MLPLHFHIRKDRPTFSITVVFTTNTEVRDHEALCDPQGDVLHRFEIEEKTFTLPDFFVKELLEFSWRQRLSPGKDEQGVPLPPVFYLEFWCRVLLSHNNKTIRVGLELLDPKLVPYKGEPSSRRPPVTKLLIVS